MARVAVTQTPGAHGAKAAIQPAPPAEGVEIARNLAAMAIAYRQEWKRLLSPGDLAYALGSALGPAVGIGWIIGRSGSSGAIAYVLLGGPLMAIWNQAVFRTGWSLSTEHGQGTLELMITTRTPVVLVMFAKSVAIVSMAAITGFMALLIVIAFAGHIPAIEEPVLLAVSAVLALTAVIVSSFIFAPFSFIAGARGGFFNAFIPFGVLLSGFVYPVHLLPAPLEVATRFLPNAWAMDAAVRSITGRGSSGNVLLDWLASLALIAACWALAAWLFDRAEKQVRVAGNLGTY